MIAERPPLVDSQARAARKAHLYERELWKLARAAQAGDAAALVAFLDLLARYERISQ